MRTDRKTASFLKTMFPLEDIGRRKLLTFNVFTGSSTRIINGFFACMVLLPYDAFGGKTKKLSPLNSQKPMPSGCIFSCIRPNRELLRQKVFQFGVNIIKAYRSQTISFIGIVPEYGGFHPCAVCDNDMIVFSHFSIIKHNGSVNSH